MGLDCDCNVFLFHQWSNTDSGVAAIAVHNSQVAHMSAGDILRNTLKQDSMLYKERIAKCYIGSIGVTAYRMISQLWL